MCSCETGLPGETGESGTTEAGTILSTTARNWALPELQIHSGGKVLRIPFPAQSQELVIGSSRQSDHIVVDPYVSRRHARFFVADGEPCIEDLGSKHGTLHNGQLIEGRARLRHGDELHLGRTLVVYLCYLEALLDHSYSGGDSTSTSSCRASSVSDGPDDAVTQSNSSTRFEEQDANQTAGVDTGWRDELIQCMAVWWPIVAAVTVVAGVTAVVLYSLARAGELQGL